MAIGVIAIIVALFFIVLYLPVGNSSLTEVEWIIVAAWLAVGAVFYGLSLRGKKQNEEACERAMYGNQ